MLAPNISNAGYNAQVIKTTYGVTSNSIKSTALGNNNADDDAAVAMAQNPLRADTTGIQQNFHNANAVISMTQILKDTLADIEEKIAEIRNYAAETPPEVISSLALGLEDVSTSIVEKVAKMKELYKEIASGGYSDRDLATEQVETFHEKMSPMVTSLKEVLAAMEEIVAKMKELWEVKKPSGSDVETNIAKLDLTL